MDIELLRNWAGEVGNVKVWGFVSLSFCNELVTSSRRVQNVRKTVVINANEADTRDGGGIRKARSKNRDRS